MKPLLDLFGSAGETPNTAYYLQPGHAEGRFEAPICLAFDGTAGVLAGSSKTNQREQKTIKTS
jgi:hypothetical protein